MIPFASEGHLSAGQTTPEAVEQLLAAARYPASWLVWPLLCAAQNLAVSKDLMKLDPRI